MAALSRGVRVRSRSSGRPTANMTLAWRNAGHEVIAIDNLDAFPESAVHAVIVNPNNPDGRVTDRAVLARWLATN